MKETLDVNWINNDCYVITYQRVASRNVRHEQRINDRRCVVEWVYKRIHKTRQTYTKSCYKIERHVLTLSNCIISFVNVKSENCHVPIT